MSFHDLMDPMFLLAVPQRAAAGCAVATARRLDPAARGVAGGARPGAGRGRGVVLGAIFMEPVGLVALVAAALAAAAKTFFAAREATTPMP